MSGSTTAIERLLEVSNNLWDTMYESGEVPTYAERYYYYLALKDVITENAKLLESLERAAGIIADICGECPVSHYEWLSSDGCAEKCGTVTEEECWIAYLTGKRWDESGVEVDE